LWKQNNIAVVVYCRRAFSHKLFDAKMKYKLMINKEPVSKLEIENL